METGSIFFVGATTESLYLKVINPRLHRRCIIQLKSLEEQESDPFKPDSSSPDMAAALLVHELWHEGPLRTSKPLVSTDSSPPVAAGATPYGLVASGLPAGIHPQGSPRVEDHGHRILFLPESNLEFKDQCNASGTIVHISGSPAVDLRLGQRSNPP